MIKQIKILPVDEMKIVKRINIVSPQHYDPDAIIGFVFYERVMNNNYKIAERVRRDDDPFNMAPYPTQADFPNDDIDEIILAAVQEKFPKSNVRNELMFSTYDIDQVNNYISRPHAKANLVVNPDFSQQDLHWLVGRSFNTFLKEINVYAEGSVKLLDNLTFRGTCDFATHEAMYNKLDGIKFL